MSIEDVHGRLHDASKPFPGTVYCARGFYPGAQSDGMRRIEVKVCDRHSHPRYAVVDLEGCNPGAVMRAVSFDRSNLVSNMRVIDLGGGEVCLELELKRPPDGTKNVHMLKKQIAEISFMLYQKSSHNFAKKSSWTTLGPFTPKYVKLS